MIEDCTAIILAGGDSRRMGQDKAMLLLHGRNLLEHVTATMQSVFPKVIVSVRQPRTGVEAPQVCDELAQGGPLAGLVAGLAQADTSWVFAVACDMPFVMPTVIEYMASLRVQPLLPERGKVGVEVLAPNVSTPSPVPPLQGGGRLAMAVVPLAGGHPQPLAAFYAVSALGQMRAALATGDKSLRGVLSKLDVRYVSEAELREFDLQLRSFSDLDTPQDYAAAQEQKWAI